MKMIEEKEKRWKKKRKRKLEGKKRWKNRYKGKRDRRKKDRQKRKKMEEEIEGKKNQKKTRMKNDRRKPRKGEERNGKKKKKKQRKEIEWELNHQPSAWKHYSLPSTTIIQALFVWKFELFFPHQGCHFHKTFFGGKMIQDILIIPRKFRGYVSKILGGV